MQCQCDDGWWTPEPEVPHRHQQRMAVHRFLQYATRAVAAATQSAYPAAAATQSAYPAAAATQSAYPAAAAARAPSYAAHGAYNMQNSHFRYQKKATTSSHYKDDDDHYGMHSSANGYAVAAQQRKIYPCSAKRPDQLTAFLLQLFLGGFGSGCFYLGHGWVILGVYCLIFVGCVCCFFPCVVCCMACGLDSIVACFTGPCRAIAVCLGCAGATKGKNNPGLDDWQQVEEIRNTRARNCFVVTFTLVGLIMWIYSLFEICNHCYIRENGVKIPCKPMHSSVCT